MVWVGGVRPSGHTSIPVHVETTLLLSPSCSKPLRLGIAPLVAVRYTTCGVGVGAAPTRAPIGMSGNAPAGTSVVYSRQSRLSAKALKVLGATEEDVYFERAVLVSAPHINAAPGADRVFVECAVDPDTEPSPAPADPESKPVKVLGLAGEPPLEWLQRSSADLDAKFERRLPSKALKTLGATLDDVRIEKALLVLGEAPGREIPAGKLPRPRPTAADGPPMWAVAPKPAAGVSIFLCAFLPWSVLAPLNVLKLQLNKVRARRARRAPPTRARAR